MSTHSFTKIDQKEYLKKYLSGDKVKKKKKDKKHKSTSSAKVKIIDDDVNHLDNGQEIDEELLLTGEDAPQIVGEYIDERPADSKVLKWKSIVIKDEPEDERDTSTQNNADLWGSKAGQVRVKQEIVKDKKRSNRSPNYSPHKRNNISSSLSPSGRRYKSPSPQRKSKRENSPPRYRTNSESPNRRLKIKPEPQSPSSRKQVLSPIPRQMGSENSFDSPRRRRNSDQSPPRKDKISATRDIKRSPGQSPPRQKRNSNYSPSKKDRKRFPYDLQNRHTKEFDQSPPRRGKSSFQLAPRRRSPEQSSSQQKRYSDQSPPRRNKSPARKDRKRSPDHSPPRRKNKYDQLPVRTRRNSDHSSPNNRTLDQSPPRRRRNSDSDHSPKRSGRSQVRKERRKRDSDQSPPKREKSPDQSPSRRRRNSDLSPPRRRRNSDHSPPRRSKNSPTTSQTCFPDNSSPRRKRESPPIRIKREKFTPEFSPPPRRSRWEKQEQEKSLSPPPSHKPKPGKTLDGKKAGLQDAKALQKETMERRRHEDHLFEKMSSDISGRNAEVQVRSTGRRGRRARAADEEDPEERKRKDEHEEKKKQKYDRWGKGLKQIEDHKNRMLEQEYESNKPLARYSNDEDLERHLKEQERAEDPMLQYMRQKRKEKEKQSGQPEVPSYEGPFPENRFGIRPGYRWDGVDRSNGYEKKYFAVQNEKRARQDEAYKYSVEDM